VGKNQTSKSMQRIAAVFLELLEQQFPIEGPHPIRMRYPSQFANQLNIHVNHLNRVIKTTLNKTTTQVISERILQEAKHLLLNTTWSVAEISNALGFSEPTHFTNFFRKYTHLNPTKFRAA